MRAALYVRVSTEDQARHGYSLSAQVDACKERAEKLGAAEVELFADEGVSGALLSRPGLDGLRQVVRSRTVDLVVVWDPDRLSRNLSHQLLLTEELERARVRLEFVNFEWKNTPEGQLFYALRGAIAQYEKEKIRERTGRGRVEKAKQGRLPTAFRPYGYDYEPDTALLVPNGAESQVVRMIFRWLVEEGEGPSAIARRLDGLGLPSRTGRPWQRAVVRQILANPVYTGVFYANRWDTTGCSLNRHRPKSERIRSSLRPRADWIPIQVPALVSQEQWNQAQAILACSRRLWAGKARAEYLLSGILVCGICGRPMTGFTGTDWGVKRRKYTCRRKGGGDPCGRTVPAEPVEQAVWGQVLSWLEDPAVLWASLASQENCPAPAAELVEVTAALARARAGRANILKLLEQGALAADEGRESLDRIQLKGAALERRREELEAAAAQAKTAATAPAPGWWRERVAAAMMEYRQGGLPAGDRRWLVRAIVTRAVVRGRTLDLHVRWPAAFAQTSRPVPQDLTAGRKS